MRSRPSGESTNFNVAAGTAPLTQFVDGGWSTWPGILPFMEGGASFNALNFNVDYNEATGMNLHGRLDRRQRLSLPLGHPIA